MAKRQSWLKKHARVLSLVLLFIVAVCSTYVIDLSPPEKQMTYGVTFSKEQSIKTGLNWKEVYSAILNDLNVNNVRLIARWDEIEPENNRFHFEDLDWQMEMAQKKNVKVILSVGQRVPRWPECFIPNWVQQADTSSHQAELLSYLREIVTHYRSFTNISHWQVENEPFLNSFGFCPKGDYKFLQKEIVLVKELDHRPIITTDSGELGLWYKAASLGDVFGTTMYRKVWNKYLGFFTWLTPASLYTLKSKLLAPGKPVYVMELQAEPWGSNFRFIADIPIGEQLSEFDIENLRANVAYARKGGFNVIYLWGAEWWYWLKQQGHEQFWEAARLFWTKQH